MSNDIFFYSIFPTFIVAFAWALSSRRTVSTFSLFQLITSFPNNIKHTFHIQIYCHPKDQPGLPSYFPYLFQVVLPICRLQPMGNLSIHRIFYLNNISVSVSIQLSTERHCLLHCQNNGLYKTFDNPLFLFP